VPILSGLAVLVTFSLDCPDPVDARTLQ